MDGRRAPRRRSISGAGTLQIEDRPEGHVQVGQFAVESLHVNPHGRQLRDPRHAETRVSQVLLTHLQMKRDPAATLAAARAQYGGQVSLVSDGDRIPITG